jgi:hypothetical protein
MKTNPSNAANDAPNSTILLPVSAGCEPSTAFHSATGLLSRAWNWIRTKQASRSSAKRLQVTASVSLGEKRFVAVIQIDGLQYLIGGGASNVSLLAKLGTKDSFEEALRERMTAPKRRLTKEKIRQFIPRTVQLPVKHGGKRS